MQFDSYTCERKTNGFLIEDFESVERLYSRQVDPEMRAALDSLLKAGAV